MSLRFCFGSSGSGKSYQLYHEIIQRSQACRNTNYLVIVPDQFTLQTQKDIVLMHPDKGIMNIDVLSFGRLSYRILEEVGGNDKPILDDTGKSLVLRKVAQEELEHLSVMKNNLKKIGYIHEVKSAISEFMQYGIGSKELEALISYAGPRNALQYKLQDLKVLYDGFLRMCRDKFITTEETLDLLREALSKSRLIRGSVIVFDGFTGFTPVQNRVIQELMRLAQEVVVAVEMGDEENPHIQDGEQRLFALSRKTVTSLKKLADEAGVPLGKDVRIPGSPVYRYRENNELAHLEQHLFRYPLKVYPKACENIVIREAAQPGEEVRLVCISIMELLREKSYKYREIAVVTGDLSIYAHQVEQEFAKYGIPFFLDRTNSILLNPFIEYIKSGIEVIQQNFSYESMFHFLRSGMLDIEKERIDRLENYVLALGIRGVKKWSSLFTRRSKEMPEECAAELAEINGVREHIITVLTPLIEMPRKITADMIHGLYKFIVHSGLQQKLAVLERQFIQAGDLRRAKEYAQIYRLVMELLTQMIELLGAEAMDLTEFAQILYAGFDEMEVGSIPHNADQVVVGDIERTRLKEVRALFFIGVNDGIIPKGSGSGGIISDIDREFLQGSELELAPTPRQQMYIQRLYLYLNMTKPSECLFLSYAKVNGEGKSLRPAYLVTTLLQLYPRLTVQRAEEKKWNEWLACPEDGLDVLVTMLREYAKSTRESIQEWQMEEFLALFQWYRQHEEYAERLERLTERSFHQYGKKQISKTAAEALYGTLLENSVSRLEKYASCAYAHFLQYGLSLQERESFRFETADMGNIFHGVLEAFARKLENSDYTWFDFPEEIGGRYVAETVDAYAAQYGGTVLFSSSRNEYIITRMKRILTRTVHTLQYQLKKGIFRPDRFEVSFAELEDIDAVSIALSGEEKMRLCGRIDRVDTYEDEENIYVKVIDYKSGHKSFDLVALYYGLQLQLVVYLNAAMAMEQKKHPDKQAVPAAVLYYHIADPVIAAEVTPPQPEEINRKLLEELKMTGVVNEGRGIAAMLDTEMTSKSDVIPVEYKQDGSFSARASIMPEEHFHAVSRYVTQKIYAIGSEILQGNVEINPYEMGKESSCTYCVYGSVCAFDEKLPGYTKRRLDGMSKEEALVRITEEG